jgi:hypothetical protein
MKEKFKEIIERLFPGNLWEYSENWDDQYQGFKLNPNNPKILLQILFTFEEEGFMKHIRIERYEMDLYNKKVLERTIIRGKAIITDQGDVDYDFYEKVLKNLQSF